MRLPDCGPPPDNARVDDRFALPDFQLVWPRSAFVAAAARLLNERSRPGWSTRCEILLNDAFAGRWDNGPLLEFREAEGGDRPGMSTGNSAGLTTGQMYLRQLMERAHELSEDPPVRRAYWSQRRAGLRTADGEAVLDHRATAREFVDLVLELEDNGYFERAFGKNCEDDPYGDAPAQLMSRDLGAPISVIDDEMESMGLWPLHLRRLAADQDLFFDVVEWLHDQVARPLGEEHWHSWNGCGRHHREFDVASGREIYRWRVNKLFARSVHPLRLAEDGEETGRLVATTDEGRTELIAAVTQRNENGEIGDQVRHAVALFRQRGASRHQKRSAVVALAGVLEERRHTVLKEHLSKGDRGALFDLANNFHLRHQDPRQLKEYDDFFLDWIFWWYLSTIELTDRLISGTPGPSPNRGYVDQVDPN